MSLNENQESESLTSDEELDELFNQFLEQMGGSPNKIPLEEIHGYVIANPNIKEISSVIEKFWRVLEKKDLQTGGFENTNPFPLISDYSRCSVLLPSYHEAPTLLRKLTDKLPGKIKIHNRPDYKAYHLHSQLDGVNCEIQIHTKESFKLKEITALNYEKWRRRKLENREAVLNDEEYLFEQSLITPMCEKIYTESGFSDVLEDIVQIKQERDLQHPQTTIREILLMVKLAAGVQNDLISMLKKILEEMYIEKENSNSVLNYGTFITR